MAALTRAPLMSIQITASDKSAKSNIQFYLGKNGANWADIGDADFITYLAEFVTAAENVSDSSFLKVSVTQEYLVDVPTAVGDEGDVEKKGVLQFNTAGGYFGRVSVPGMTEDNFATDGISIRRTGTVFEGPNAADLQNIHDKLQNGATVNLVTYPVVDGSGRDFNGLSAAYKQHRKSVLSRRKVGG